MHLTTKYRIAVTATVVLASLAAFSVVLACGGASQFETVQTFEAEERIRISTATAEARVAAGLDPDALASGGVAATFVAERNMTATAQAEAGESVGVGSGSEQEGSTDAGGSADDFNPEVPDGPAAEGEVTVTISQGEFDPQVIKIKAGTTVIWENTINSASSATNVAEDSEEQWDTGALSKSAFNPEKCCGQHTFTIPNEECYVYRSEFSGDQGVGAVCVVE